MVVMDDEDRTAILDVLEKCDTMVLATVREDGFPQATTVNFVHDGLSIYFYCDAKTQKVRNLRKNPKVSAAIGDSAPDWNTVRGVSLGGWARRTTDPEEMDMAMTLSIAKYPQMVKLVPEDFQEPLCFRIDAVAFSILDYTQGFGHSRLVAPPDLEESQRRGWVPKIAGLA